MENTCKTCINNDDGLCDRKGILVEDEDSCEHHWAAGKKIRMKRREKKMDITPELMLSAYNTLIQGCKSRPASEDGICSRCILYQRCPHIDNAIPADWEEIHYPYEVQMEVRQQQSRKPVQDYERCSRQKRDLGFPGKNKRWNSYRVYCTVFRKTYRRWSKWCDRV